MHHVCVHACMNRHRQRDRQTKIQDVLINIYVDSLDRNVTAVFAVNTLVHAVTRSKVFLFQLSKMAGKMNDCH